MGAAPVTRHRDVRLAGIGLGVVDELGKSLGCKRWVDQHDQRHPEQSGDRCDVTDEIEVQLLVERRIDRVRSNAGKKRVAVRGCTYNGFGGDIAASAGPVLDNKMLPQPLRQPVTDQTCGKGGWATATKSFKHPHRPHGIRLRPRAARECRQRGSSRYQMQKSTAGKCHGVPSPSFIYAKASD